ncbi:MAG: M20 family metallopeptidase [Fuerstiella sp.]
MLNVALLEELIRFPSVSNVSNVDVSRWTETRLQSLGFRTEWLEYTDDEGITKVCVSGRKGPDQGRGLAYFCHTDVVPVGSWSFPASGPWEPHRADNRLYGRGSCDMKGSLACMLAAASEIDDSKLTAPLSIVCTADEEVGLRGAKELVAKSDYFRDIVKRQSRGIVGEPTLLDVVHAHKGGRAFRILSRGRAAHSSTGKGLNANFAMIPFLAEIKAICDELEGDPAWQDDRFDPPTINLNLGVNDHTHALNITPAQSVSTIYFRTMPAVDAQSLCERIRSAAEANGLEIETLFETEPLFTDPDSAFIGELLELTGAESSRTVAYGTDGSCFGELDDVVVIGPGDIRQAHTDDEWISLEQMERGTQIYGDMIRRWCTES